MMRDAIEDFAKQFAYDPLVVHAEKLPRVDAFVVAGMGGSHWAADLLKIWKPDLNVTIHSDYGMPLHIKPEWLSRMLFIASSYSGNTEEPIDAYQRAGEHGAMRVVVAAGGKLLAMAKVDGVPYIQLPDTGIQPRSALGFSMKALLKIMGEQDALLEISRLSDTLKPAGYEAEGKALAEKIKGCVPVIYASARNAAIAQNWKIKFNETGKIPAFSNVFPELNHNEMTGFDVSDATRDLSRNFFFIFLKDVADDPRIIKRMGVTEDMYRNRGLQTTALDMRSASVFEKIFSSLLVADWAAYYTAEAYGLESEQVPMVEEFKKLIA